MKAASILILVFLIFLAGCTSRISTAEQAYVAIQDLDAQYSAEFKEEMINKLIIGRAEMNAYLEDLKSLERLVLTSDEKQKKHISWLIEARRQMLLSQINFQKAWFVIGKSGRVTEGFQCSEINKIKKATLLFEQAWSSGTNATKLLDALMSENEPIRNVIGTGKNKPEFYNSDFEGIYVEIKSNVDSMKIYCNLEVPTQIIDFSKVSEKEDQNERT